ncbi:MAG: hypothetical protein QG567_1304, partial [Campylobacterota bacterium]|nr:hypothetical protein [Campylobacterota bacterium]
LFRSDIDKIFSKQGFDNKDGDSEIESVIKDKTKKYKDDWGIFDGYVFEYVKSKLQNAKTPQFVMIMTTTNHPPYVVEPDYKPKPLNIPSVLQKRIMGAKELVNARFVAYQYANEKTGEFLSGIKNSELKEKTIVAITGDHNFGGVINFSNEEHLKFRGVPFYIYAPKELRPKNYDREAFGSHKDIMPTLYALSLSNISHVSIGKNMFDGSLEHYSFNASGFVASKDGAVLHAKPSVYFKWDGDLLKNDENSEKYKKIVDYYKATLSVTEYFVQSHLKKEE